MNCKYCGISCHCNSSASTKPEIDNPFTFDSPLAGEGEEDDEADAVADDVDDDADDDDEADVDVDNKAGVLVADAGGVVDDEAVEDEEINDEDVGDGVVADETPAAALIDNEVADEDIGNELLEDNSFLLFIIIVAVVVVGFAEVFSIGSI